MQRRCHRIVKVGPDCISTSFGVKSVTAGTSLCVGVCVYQCVWSWPVQRSWLLKGQSVSVSPADSTLLSPVCGNCASAWLCVCMRAYLCACRWKCVCVTEGEESWKVSASADLLQTPPALPRQLPVARSRSGYTQELPLGQLHDPWPQRYHPLLV